MLRTTIVACKLTVRAISCTALAVQIPQACSLGQILRLLELPSYNDQTVYCCTVRQQHGQGGAGAAATGGLSAVVKGDHGLTFYQSA